MEWRTRWHITIRWDRADNSPAGVTVVERVVDTLADLRNLVNAARADPHVVAFPYRPVRELVGDEPTECRNGHVYAGGSATRPRRDWWPCSCGGHLVIRCRDCGDVRAEPRHCRKCIAGQRAGDRCRIRRYMAGNVSRWLSFGRGSIRLESMHSQSDGLAHASFVL